MSTNSDRSALPLKPRIILHGGAGNITRENLPFELWKRYQAALLRILRSTATLLDPTPPADPRFEDCNSFKDAANDSLHHFNAHKSEGKNITGADALTAAIHAVQQLEDDPLFNAGVGAVFNRAGRIELEASVMVSSGRKKRGVGVSGIQHVRSPVGLAAEVLRRGGEEPNGGGAQGHVQLNGEYVEGLAREWGLQMCEERVFYTRRRWEEHRRGLEREKEKEREYAEGRRFDDQGESLKKKLDHDRDRWTWRGGDPGWDELEYLPQGTVGCVVLDSYGTLAVASSTGGMTNKLPGRIGDTPTLGAGLWAEDWQDLDDDDVFPAQRRAQQLSTLSVNIPRWTALVARNLANLGPSGIIGRCLGLPLTVAKGDSTGEYDEWKIGKPNDTRHAVAIGGTGNGDSFVKLCAVRTVASRVRFSRISLADAVAWMAGPGGELQRSAEHAWPVTGEGEGGMIGIELKGGQGTVVAEFNKAMFRAWIDDEGKENCMVFREDY